MKIQCLLAFALLTQGLASCAAQPALPPAGATLQGDPGHPAQAEHWVSTQLFFALGSLGQSPRSVSEAGWRDFLDSEVTPRFPDGLSVLDVYGQWRGRHDPALTREHSKLLVIDYPDTPDNRARVEAIRAAWKQRHGGQSVLRVTQPADISF